MASFEIEGKLHKKSDTQKVSETFRKRELVIEVDDGKYPQFVPFELLQDRCSVLDPFNEGDLVKVSFNLRGREWNNRYFCSLNAWRIEKVSGSDTQAEKPKEVTKVETDDGKDSESDLPF